MEEESDLKEKNFTLISDNNEYKVKLYIIDDNFCIKLTTNKISKTYDFTSTLDDLKNINDFFKIFKDLKEIFIELEKKIEKSKIIEESNLIKLVIPIGLNIINDVILVIYESK